MSLPSQANHAPPDARGTLATGEKGGGAKTGGDSRPAAQPPTHLREDKDVPHSTPLPVLLPRTQIEFMGPGVARLPVQHDVVGCNVVRVEDGVLRAQVIDAGHVLANEVGINRPVDDGVRNVDVQPASTSGLGGWTRRRAGWRTR